MFGAKYSRTTYWVWSIVLLILNIFATIISKAPVGDIENISGFQILFAVVLLSLPSILWINTLANRIRDYGSNPWLALWALLPIVNIVLGFYYGIVQYKKNPSISNNSSNSSLTNAVLNHAKEVASEVKPMVEKYKHSHTTVDNMNEDEIYEKIMLEIEEDKKVKATWAKALEQADGNKDKAESLYIKFRAQAIKIELEAEKQEIHNQKILTNKKLAEQAQLEKEKIDRNLAERKKREDERKWINARMNLSSNEKFALLTEFIENMAMRITSRISDNKAIAYNTSDHIDKYVEFKNGNWQITEVVSSNK